MTTCETCDGSGYVVGDEGPDDVVKCPACLGKGVPKKKAKPKPEGVATMGPPPGTPEAEDWPELPADRTPDSEKQKLWTPDGPARVTKVDITKGTADVVRDDWPEQTAEKVAEAMKGQTYIGPAVAHKMAMKGQTKPAEPQPGKVELYADIIADADLDGYDASKGMRLVSEAKYDAAVARNKELADAIREALRRSQNCLLDPRDLQRLQQLAGPLYAKPDALRDFVAVPMVDEEECLAWAYAPPVMGMVPCLYESPDYADVSTYDAGGLLFATGYVPTPEETPLVNAIKAAQAEAAESEDDDD